MDDENPFDGADFLSPDLLLALADVVEKYYDAYYNKRPCRTSSLSGAAYVTELLTCGNNRRIKEVLRMRLPTFLKLCNWFKEHGLLSDERYVSVEEQVAIFLHIVGENRSNRSCQERFQHSGWTINRLAGIPLNRRGLHWLTGLCAQLLPQSVASVPRTLSQRGTTATAACPVSNPVQSGVLSVLYRLHWSLRRNSHHRQA
jgi:hypothetical protein